MGDPGHPGPPAVPAGPPGPPAGAPPGGPGAGQPPGDQRPVTPSEVYGPAAGPPGGPPPGPPVRRGWQASPRSTIWAIAIVAVVAILVRTHHISSTEIILFCVMIPSIILHEISHGVVALWFGDDTAKRAGRLTLNPIAHIDPIGTLLVPAVMALSGYGFFGWAKPVPVNLGKLRNPRNHGVLVSLAGPATNVALAAAAGLAFVLAGGDTAVTPGGSLLLWAEVLFYLGLVNIGLAVFNLLPIPPLDGSVLFERLLPRAWWPAYLRLRPYTMPVVLVLIIINLNLHPGPLTWLYEQLFTWWAHVLGV